MQKVLVWIEDKDGQRLVLQEVPLGQAGILTSVSLK